jgi:hypothetical protein
VSSANAGVEPYVEGAKLGVRVLVVDALLQGAHRLLGLHGLGADDVGDLEVESDVFPVDGLMSAMALVAVSEQGFVSVQAAACGLLYLLIQGRIGPGGPPPHHVEEGMSGTGNAAGCWSVDEDGLVARGVTGKAEEGAPSTCGVR